MTAADGKPVTQEDQREAARTQDKLTRLGGTDQGAGGGGSLVGAPGSPETYPVEYCDKCGQALPKPSEQLATG